MAGLDDLVGKSGSLDDLLDSEVGKVEIKNPPSNVNMAAHISVLADNPEDVEALYKQASLELDAAPSAPTLDSLVSFAKSKNFDKNKQALAEYLADDSVSDEDKRAAAIGTLDLDNAKYSIRNTLSTESLEADSVGESPRMEFTRVSLADVITDVNEYKSQAQAILNREVARTDAGTLNAYADIFEYFLPFVESKFAGDVLDGMREGEGWAYDESFTLLGNAKQDLRSMVESVPASERLEFTERLVAMINSNSSIVIPDENGFAKVDFLRTVLEDGYYEDSDKWIDNAISVLDLVGVGTIAKRLLKPATKALGLGQFSVSQARDAVRRSVRSRVQPTSVSQNVKDTNPGMAKSAHEAAAADDTGEVAQAMYGTTRDDALANDLMAEVATESGRVQAKLSIPESIHIQETGPNAEIMDFVNKTGATQYFQQEKVAMRARVVNNMAQVDGMKARKEMFQVSPAADGVNVKAVYGPPGSGYTNPRDAVDTALWAMRDYGVQEADLTLLVREGSEYVSTTIRELEATKVISDTAQKLMAAKGKKANKNLEAARKAGVLKKRQPDYLIQVEHNYKFSPGDVAAWSEADVKYNFMDRAGLGIGKAGAGSAQRHLLNPASMLHPQVQQPFAIAADRGARLEQMMLNLGDDFATKFKKLDPERQSVMDQMIRRANDEGLDYSYTDMVANGLTPSEIDAMKSWRNFWDQAYVLENRDLARTLRAQGYQELIDTASDTRLVVKPIKQRGTVGATARVFDYTTGEARTLNRAEIDEIYRQDGSLARLRQPMDVGDEAVDLVINSNNPNGSYTRGFNDTSQVLNYRKGYYTVQYTDPYYVVKVVKNANGEELYQKAVATAGGIKDAQLKARNLAQEGGENVEYIYRRDEKKGSVDTDNYWDVQQARGRTAQRVRGERLEDTTSTLTDLSQAPIMDPVESMVLSARSISARTSMRDVLETNKQRFIANYGEFMPTGKFGEPQWPSNIKDIKYRKKGSENNDKLGDARTTFEYIQYMENGYINHMDDFYKASLRRMSDIVGNAGLTKLEKGLQWASDARGPTGMAKNLAFNMYLATSPFRQLIVQSHQAVQLAAINPRWFTEARMFPETSMIVAQQMGYKVPPVVLKGLNMTQEEAAKVFKQWQDSGLAASIDKQNLIRGALADIVDQTQQGKAMKVATAPITAMRKVGFDAGEYANMMTSWLAHRDMARRAGKNLDDPEVLDEISGLARNYTYGMNVADDMPYNQNALAAVFQFMQVPHKAMTSMLTNRQLTKQQKARLIAFNATMYTLPPAAMMSLFGHMLPEEPGARDLIVNGLEGWAFNQFLSKVTGEDTYLDWSDLSPADMFGTYDFIHSLTTTDIGTILANTPSGQLVAGNNPRITNFMKSAARLTNLIDDYEDPTTFGQVAHNFAKLSSGYTNMFKAAYAQKYGMKISTLGGITDPEVTSAEAVAQAFGFRTMDETLQYYVNDQVYKKSQAFREDVEMWYKDMKSHTLQKGIDPRQQEFVSRSFSEAFRVFGNDDTRAKDIIRNLIERDIADGDIRMYKRIVDMNEIMPTEEVKSLLNGIPDLDPQLKQQGYETLDYINSLKE